MTNQHNSPKALAGKAQTNAKLQEAVQSPIRTSDRLRAELNQELQQRLDRRAQVAGILQAFSAEMEDENRSIDALNRALDALAEEVQQPSLHLVIDEP